MALVLPMNCHNCLHVVAIVIQALAAAVYSSRADLDLQLEKSPKRGKTAPRRGLRGPKVAETLMAGLRPAKKALLREKFQEIDEVRGSCTCNPCL